MATFPITLNRTVEAGMLVYETYTPIQSPVTVNYTLDSGLLNYEAYTPVQSPISLNRTMEAGLVVFMAGPYLLNQAPGTIIPCILTTAAIAFTIGQTLPQTVDLTTLSVVLRNMFLGTTQTVLTGGVYQAGFTGTITDVSTAMDNLQRVSFSSTVLATSTVYRVEVAVSNSAALPLAPVDYWTFSTCSAAPPPPPPPPPAAPVVHPQRDTIRGGLQLVVYGNSQLVDPTQDISFLGQNLPTGWTSTLAGAGNLQSLATGLVLQTGRVASSSVVVSSPTSPATFQTFDATLTCSLLGQDQVITGPINHLIWTFQLNASNYISVRLRRDPNILAGALFAESIIAIGAQEVISGGLLAVTGSDFSLEIVRYLGSASVFVNGVLLASTKRLSQTALGFFTMQVDNGTQAQQVATQLKTVTMRSHAMVNGRLLQSKVDFSTYRITGLVPAATLAEVGLWDIICFGPWGSAILMGGFRYVLPAGRTVGNNIASVLSSYTDPAVRD